jgi:hypothetical protein
MNRMFLVATAFAVAAALQSAPAQALNTRSFISANGSDTNACTRTAPCRTLQKAHDSTSARGEINVLDPAGYGTVIITKAISIVNDGVGSAGVLVPSGGTGITINGGVTDVINLRGLIIEGAGVGQTGIAFNTGALLTVQNCVIRAFAGNGIAFLPNGSSGLFVSDAFIANNGKGVGGNGIYVSPSGSGIVGAVFNRVEAVSNGGGIQLDGHLSTGTVQGTVEDSVASNNTIGFFVQSNLGQALTSLTVIRSVSANNSTGIEADTSRATIRIGQSTVTGNVTGWLSFGDGILESYGDNYIHGNGGNSGSLTPISKQ